MTERLKKYLYKQMNSIEGLHAIVASDREGVPVLKVANEKAPDYALRPAFLGTYPVAADQAGKLGLGPNKFMICAFSNFTIVHFNRHPLTVTFVSSNTANIGMILNLSEELEECLAEVKKAVAEVTKEYLQS